MKTDQTAPQTIDEYIAGFPQEVQEILQEIRKTIRAAAPDAEEKISYRMPTFALEGNLVHFAAFKNHIGLYPAPTGIAKFKKELAAYQGAKGSIRFPLDEPIPLDLIARIVQFRVKENLAKAKAKGKDRRLSHTRVEEHNIPPRRAVASHTRERAVADFNPEHRAVLDELLLGRPFVRSGKMFGFPAYYAGNKLCICLYEQGVGVKLPEPSAARLLKTDLNVVPFRPMGKPKMREWVQINLSRSEDYGQYRSVFDESIRYVLSQQEK